MVTKNQYRRAVQIVNNGEIGKLSDGTFIVVHPNGTNSAHVFSYRDGSGRTRWVSDSQYFRRTGREDCYIAAAKLITGNSVLVAEE